MALLSLSIYLLTLVPEVDWGDAAELSLQSYQLGVTHPPGYPLHTWLGKAFGLFIAEPALATNLLSAACSAFSVGILAWIGWHLTGSWLASTASALTFGLSPLVWEKAVVTEVYNVNVCFVAITIAALLIWRERPTWARLLGAGLAFGLSLGAYLANLLFLPALLFAIVSWSRNRRWPAAALFTGVTLVIGALVISWSFFRSGQITPVGTQYIPDSPAGFLRYLAGAQYGTTVLPDAGFYASRLLQHGRLFAKNLLGLGVFLGLLGLWRQFRGDRNLAIGLALIFAINFGYFTAYGAPDYAYMVTPSYLVFCMWIAQGLAYLLDRPGNAIVRVAAMIACVVLVLGLLAWKLPERWTRARSRPVTEFVLSSYAAFPERAIVVSAWRRFTPLLYYQVVHGLRSDVMLVERKDEPRSYAHGTAGNWWNYVAEQPDSSPVYIDRLDPDVPGVSLLRHLDDTWQQIEVASSAQ